jgi:hypothetical protein
MSADFEKIAQMLAERAVSVKRANSPFFSREAIGTGLAGAGLGALMGATSRKNKLRNALMYGLGGGIAGMGAGMALRNYNSQQAATRVDIPNSGKKLEAPKPPATAASQLQEEAAKIKGPARVTGTNMLDIGADPSLSDYENWKINPQWRGHQTLTERAWPGNWSKSDATRNAEYLKRWQDEQTKLKQAIKDSLRVPFTKRPSLREIKAPYNLPGVIRDPINPLTQYKDYNLSDPTTLDLIRQARAAGFGSNIEEFMRRRQQEINSASDPNASSFF